MKKTYIDLHCHPTIKPFGKSFDASLKHSANARRKNSIWFRDRPDFFEKLLNWTTTMTKFTQSDFATLHKGNCKIISVSLYPLERGFFDVPFLNLGTGNIADILTNLVLGIGRKRIDFVQKNSNYFLDLENEYKFLKALNNEVVRVRNKNYRYKIVKSFQEIQESSAEDTIFIVLSIEGAHVFNCGYDPVNNPAAPRKAEVLEKVRRVKNWEYPPLFITFAHHFYNELCGHERTFKGIVGTAIGKNQELGLNEGITPLGWDVLDTLLDKTSGQRIYIDVKHMNIKSRKAFYAYLNQDQFTEDHIPIIVSHGAVTGAKRDNAEEETIPGASKKFLNEPINFYDFELLLLQKSGGIFGLQLDERRIASKDVLKKTRSFRFRRKKIQFHWSRLVWYQIQHIAEVLDKAGLPAWELVALGSDFDGIIDPLSSFWNAEAYPALEKNLLIHANDYLKSAQMTLETNRITAKEIVARVMYKNAAHFLEKYLHSESV